MSRHIFTPSIRAHGGSSTLQAGCVLGNIASETALRLIGQWARQHEPEIRAHWRRMKAGQALEAIEPLR